MPLNNLIIHIDMLAFCRTGKFDYLTLGQTQEWIIHNFPPPECVSFHQNDIWQYGDIELHFNHHCLSMIFSDHFAHRTLSGGKNLHIEPWIFTGKMTLLDTIIELNNQQIDFEKKSSEYFISLILSSGVHLIFSPIDEHSHEHNDFVLNAFSFSQSIIE